MNPQLKKGFLEYCVLVVLLKSDSYGYQIVKDTSEIIEITESTLYPILKRLEANKSLETYSIEHNGRLRKYYKITTIGKQHINDFLKEWDEVLVVYNFIRGSVEND